MSKLRELFERYNDPTSCYSIWVYDLLKALVEAVEPEHICNECKFYTLVRCNNAPAYLGGWKFTKPDSTACKRFIVSSPESEDTDAAIRKLREELAEAKALIERWRKESNLEMAARMMGEPLSPGLETRFEKLESDATLGRLVRGMRPVSTLARNADDVGGLDWAALWDSDDGSINTSTRTDDPAEALRAIQTSEEEEQE